MDPAMLDRYLPIVLPGGQGLMYSHVLRERAVERSALVWRFRIGDRACGITGLVPLSSEWIPTR